MEANEAGSPPKRGRAPIVAALFAMGAAAFLLSSSSASSSAENLVSSTMRRVLSEDTTVTDSAQDGGVSDTNAESKNYGPSYASQLLEPIDYYEVCFVKSVYSANPENLEEADEIPHISPEFTQNYPQIGSYLFIPQGPLADTADTKMVRRSGREMQA